MYDSIKFRIQGVTPTIVHNGRLANPLDPIVKKIKELTSKRNKTDSDLEELARLEWTGGHYENDDEESCWPGECIEAMLVSAAQKSRKGKDVKAGLMVDGLIPIIHPGPKKIPDMWGDENFRLTNKVKIQKSSVMRTRPIFRTWEMQFDVSYLPDVLNPQFVRDTMIVAGRLVGLSDWRPKFGRFEVVA